MDRSGVTLIVSTLKPVTNLRPGNGMALLVLAGSFTFENHLSNRTIYDFKEQFSKLAAWNMY